MLELVPKGVFSSRFVLRTPEFESIEFEASSFRERAEFQYQGSTYKLYRKGALRGDFLLDRDGTTYGRAVKPSAFRNSFELDLGGRAFSLRKKSIWKREYVVLAGEEHVGSIRRAGGWTRKTLVDVPADWPVPYQLFVFWLAQIMWRREESAAAG